MWQGLIEQMAKLRSVTEIAPKSSFLCEEQNPYLPCEPWFLQAGRYVRPGETTDRRVIPTRCGVNTESVAKPSCCCCCFLSNYVVGVLFVYFDYMLEFQPVLSRISIGLCHAFSYLYVSSLQLIFKNNGPVLLLKTIFRHWTDSCYGSLAVSGQDGHWSKL